MKEESKKAGLKFNIQKTKIMAVSPITSWQIDGEKVEKLIDFIFLSSKITVDGNYSHEIKRHLLLERKTMTDIVLKSRDHFANKGLYSQNYGFSSSHVRMWELDHKEGWASMEEFMLLNCRAGEDSWESLVQQGDQTSES